MAYATHCIPYDESCSLCNPPNRCINPNDADRELPDELKELIEGLVTETLAVVGENNVLARQELAHDDTYFAARKSLEDYLLELVRDKEKLDWVANDGGSFGKVNEGLWTYGGNGNLILTKSLRECIDLIRECQEIDKADEMSAASAPKGGGGE